MKITIKQLKRIIKEEVLKEFSQSSKKTRVRPQRGGFQESMSQTIEVSSREELIEWLGGNYGFMNPSEENVTVEPYGFDERNKWDTFIISIDGQAVAFSDGKL